MISTRFIFRAIINSL